MNVLEGNIKSIQTSGSLSLVKITVGDFQLTSIVIDTPSSSNYLKESESVKVIFKETEVILGNGNHIPISLQNRLIGNVTSIDSGELLSKVTIETSIGQVSSIITTNAVQQLGIEIGKSVTAMIKTNEMMLSK